MSTAGTTSRTGAPRRWFPPRALPWSGRLARADLQRPYAVLALLGGAVLVAWYVAPIGLMALRLGTAGDFTKSVGLSDLERTLYVRTYLHTFQIAAVVTLETLVLGYAVAYVLTRVPQRVAAVLISLVLIPFWISIIVRTYALLVVFGRTGLFNQALLDLAIVREPLQLMFTTTMVYIGMAQALLPFMILTIYSALRGIDERVLVAARSLGARELQVFLHVVFPLSLPGVWAGSVLVFILALGFFVTPALLGGPRDMMVAQLIHSEATVHANFGGAILLAIPLLLITLAIVWGFDRFLGLDRMWGGQT